MTSGIAAGWRENVTKMADERGRRSLSRKLKKTKISRPEKDEEPQTCIICLDNISCRGKLGVCEHWFCFPCIFEWSKVGHFL